MMQKPVPRLRSKPIGHVFLDSWFLRHPEALRSQVDPRLQLGAAKPQGESLP
jgi:hypothetical protein